MPEFRFSGTLDGVPSDLRPGDGRVGAALAAAPVSVDGVIKPVVEHFADKAGLDPDTGKLLQSQTDLTKGGDYRVDLALPAILTIAEEVKARGVIPAARLAITGGSADQTARWQAACTDALLTYKRPVELNLGASHRVGSRLRFPSGSGIVNPGGAGIVADCTDFNNTSADIGPRYGANAVVLSAAQGASGVRFEAIKLALQTSSSAVFKERRVQGIVLFGCPDAVITDADLSGFNAGALINLQSCKNFRLVRPYCHDSLVHTASTVKTASQLTGILIDGDEMIDGSGNRIGSSGRIEFPRIINLRCTAEVIAAVGDQTDGINVGGINADVFILHPYIENVAEPLDTFGRVVMIGGRILNASNFAIKLVHGAQDCRIEGFEAANVGIAGVTMQSTSDEPRGISRNVVRGSLRNVGVLNLPALVVNGATAPAVSTAPAAAGGTFEVLFTDISATYPVENNLIDLDIQGSGRSTNPIRVTTNGSGNVVRYTNRDGTTDAKGNVLSGTNTIRRTDKSTNVNAYAASAQSFTTTAAVVVFGTKASDPLGEWDGTTFRPKLAGTYRIEAAIRFPGTATTDTLTMVVRQNGAGKKIDKFGVAAGQLAGRIQHTLTMAQGDTADVTAEVSPAQSNGPAGELYTVITIARLLD